MPRFPSASVIWWIVEQSRSVEGEGVGGTGMVEFLNS
jgi:hypothetical protein